MVRVKLCIARGVDFTLLCVMCHLHCKFAKEELAGCSVWFRFTKIELNLCTTVCQAPVHGYQHPLNFIEYMTLIWANRMWFHQDLCITGKKHHRSMHSINVIHIVPCSHSPPEYQSLSTHVCEMSRSMADILDRLFTEVRSSARHSLLAYNHGICENYPGFHVQCCNLCVPMSTSRRQRSFTDAVPVSPHWE